MKNNIKALLSFLAMVGFLVCLYLLFLVGIPPASKDVVLVLIGALTGVVKDVYGFYFGSSSGSERKTEIMSAPSFDPSTPSGEEL